MKRTILGLFFIGLQIGILTGAAAQATHDYQPATVQHLYKLNFLSPGAGYERALSRKITIDVNASLSPVLYLRQLKFANNTEKNEALLNGALQLETQGRYYYNLDKRSRKGLNVSGNSGNYFALSSAISRNTFTIYDAGNRIGGSAETNNNTMPAKYSFKAAARWGLQRTYNNLYLNIEAGVAYQVNSDKASVLPELKFRFGYLLFR